MYPVAYVSDKDSAGIVVVTRAAPSRTVQMSHAMHLSKVLFAEFADFNFTQLIALFGLLDNLTPYTILYYLLLSHQYKL